ncbi:MAG: hypothetical protein GY765_06665 [bacterium]|nr:hypothetical protein [bacterium]
MSIKEQWQLLAEEIGFKFYEGIEALIESPVMMDIARMEFPDKVRDIEQVSAMLGNPMVKKMLSTVFLGIATGSYKEFDFFVYRSRTSSGSNSASYYFNVVLIFKKSYKLGMEITSAGFFSSLGKKLFSKSYIRIPNAPLDPMVVIKGENRQQIEVLLSHSPLQEQLVNLYSHSRDFKVTDSGIRYKTGGQIRPKEFTLSIMDKMVEAAKHFY